jgi:RNA polymerase sigma-70 factor (ECF subfamily)
MLLALFRRRAARTETRVEEAPDEELMYRYAGGEVEAFEEILRRHEKAVFNFIARFLGDRTAAEDLVQEVFLRVIRTAPRYKKKAKFRTWLFTITRNLCIDRSRKLRRRPEVSLNRSVSSDDENGTTFLDQMADENPTNGAAGTIRAEFRARLQAALAELPDEQREVFTLREFGGMKFREIAEVTDVSENTVKSRMRYALQTLRGHLEEYRGFSFDAAEERDHATTS